VCLIRQNENEDVAMIAKSELDSLLETVYLLKSPENAKRLLSALDRAVKNNKKL
jgi:antitoxin YefM